MTSNMVRTSSINKVYSFKLTKIIKAHQKVLVFVILLCLSIFTIEAIASTCPSSVTDATTVQREQNYYTGFSSTETYTVKPGMISNALYYSQKISSPSRLIVRKINLDNSVAWMAAFSADPVSKSLAVDPSENNVYDVYWTTPLHVLKLDCTTGAFISAKQFDNLNGGDSSVRIHPLNDNSGYYIIASSISTGKVNTCKHVFTSSTTISCQESTNLSGFGKAQLKLSDSKLFILGIEPTSPYHLKMYLITFGSTPVDWSNKINCPSGSCSLGHSESISNSDGSLIYTIFPYGSTQYVHLISVSSVNGIASGSRYKSNNSCTSVRGFSLSNSNLAVSVWCSSVSEIVIYNIETNIFTIRKPSSSPLIYGIATEPVNGRFVLVGDKSNKGYISKFAGEALLAQPDLFASSLSFSALSIGSYDIISESGVTISALSSQSITSVTYTNISVSFINSTSDSYISDVHYLITIDSYLNLIESTYKEITADLPCSGSGLTSISYSISDYKGITAPTWVVIDSASGLLKITCPSLSANTNYSFLVNSLISGSIGPISKVINIRVLKCTAQNCQKCTSSNSAICDICSSSYILSSGSCVNPTVSQSGSSAIPPASQTSTSTPNSHEVSKTANNINTATKAIVGTAAFATLVSRFI